MKIRKIIILFIFLFILLSLKSTVIIYSENNNDKAYSILILGSYSSENQWEKSIIKGFKQNIGSNIVYYTEFLDSKAVTSEIYNKNFIELLNIKYKDKNIDCIITMDDEALQLARQNLFNEDSFTYKKPIIFVGINEYIYTSNEETDYITGLFEYPNNLIDIETILRSSKKIQDIYVLLDKSIYSHTIKENILTLSNFTSRPFKVHIIEGQLFEDIEDRIQKINDDQSAIFLCGSFMYKEGIIMKPNELINQIKNITKAPIYTKLRNYIECGAVGGIVNDGERLGSIVANFLEKVLYENNKVILTPAYNTYHRPIFNYKSVMYYNINPLKLPRNSEYINRPMFSLLLPKNIQVLIIISLVLYLIILTLFIIRYIKDKKRALQNDKLLTESIERDEIRTDFILTISHELRTPLNIITNATKLLKLKIDKDDYEEDFFYKQLGIMNTNTNRLLRLINNLIDVSKIETGHVDTNFKNENIVEIIEEATLSVVDLANTHNISIIFDTDEEEIITSLDKSKIERIMLNLLSNAIKFTNDGGEILVNIKKEEKNIIVEVKDNGIGMSEELQVHLFEKFKRANLYPSLKRDHEGSGLGLFIVKGLVELHQGNIQVESNINKGSKFIITIPQRIIDKKQQSSVVNMSIDYISQIELSDIYNNK